jgi:hypothetical protein
VVAAPPQWRSLLGRQHQIILMNWKRKPPADEPKQEQTSVPQLTNCPMCESTLPEGQTLSTCPDCGADLSRWIRKPPRLTTPSLNDTLERRDQQTLRTARNSLYSLAATYAAPALFWITCTAVMSPQDEDKVILCVSVCTLPLVLCVMSLIGALKISAGRKSGKLWAFLPIWVLMFSFPIGTLVAYKTYSRLSEADMILC